jgi:hypothetical protein
MLTPGGDLQFERAEYAGGSTGPACCTCKQPATPQYHQFNGRVFCTNCRQQIEQSIQQLHQSGSLAQAALFGLGAAALAAGILYAVTALTRGIQFGVIGVLAGYLVGKAVRKGSGSAGGMQYQGLAMLLTYLSFAGSYAIEILRSVQAPGGVPYLRLFDFALAAPVMGGFRNILGMIIIGIALWQAWKMNRRVDVKFTGPFTAGA